MSPDIQMRSLNSFAGLVVHRLLQDSNLNIYEIGVRKENRCAIMKPHHGEYNATEIHLYRNNSGAIQPSFSHHLID